MPYVGDGQLMFGPGYLPGQVGKVGQAMLGAGYISGQVGEASSSFGNSLITNAVRPTDNTRYTEREGLSSGETVRAMDVDLGA